MNGWKSILNSSEWLGIHSERLGTILNICEPTVDSISTVFVLRRGCDAPQEGAHGKASNLCVAGACSGMSENMINLFNPLQNLDSHSS